MLNDITGAKTLHGKARGYKPEELIYLSWITTTTCNFDCRYCPSELHDGRWGFPEYDKVINFFKSLKNQLPKKCYITTELLGGEPTLWPKLLTFLSELQELFQDGDQKIMIMLDTNMSRTNRWWQKIKEADLHMMTVINASYHADVCDPELFYSNLEIICDKYQTNANMMLDPKHFWKIVNLMERIKGKIPVDFTVKVLRPNLAHDKGLINGYTDEMLEYINKEEIGMHLYPRSRFNVPGDKVQWPLDVHAEYERVNWQSIVVKKQHNLKGWKCSAGSKRFFINPNGDVYPCSRLIDVHITPTERFITTDQTGPNRKYIIGNINEGDVAIYNKYITCPINYCSCKIDTVCHKYKINTTV